MAYFDSIKIGGTTKQVQVVQELKALPSPVLETSPQLVKIGNDLYMRESKTGGAYGTYRFMLVPTNQQVYNIEFVSNGQTFGEIIINANGEMTYNNTLVYSNGNWVNKAYKTIAIFGGNFTNALYSFLGNNAEVIIHGYFKYIKVSSDSSAGTTIIDITDLDEIPTQYQDAELLKTAILFDVDHLLRLTWIDDMYYYGNTDDFQYRYLSVDTNDFIIMRYDLQDIAKAPKIVDLNNFVPKTATQGTLERGALNVLQASNENYIVFNDEIFRLADKQHNAGYLVYSHNGHDTTGCFFQKCITITLSSRSWVLETQENQAKLTAGSNITIENNVISATGGGGTSDTAYVSDSTLYIEEGTTAGGGSSGSTTDNIFEIDLTSFIESDEDFDLFMQNFKDVVMQDADSLSGYTGHGSITSSDFETELLTQENIKKIVDGDYNKLKIIYNYNGQFLKNMKFIFDERIEDVRDFTDEILNNVGIENGGIKSVSFKTTYIGLNYLIQLVFIFKKTINLGASSVADLYAYNFEIEYYCYRLNDYTL